jgi:hypothetical protein
MGKAISTALFVCLAVLLLGCSWGQTASSGYGAWTSSPPSPPEASSSLGVLNWTAGLAILGGIVSMVITRGSMGMRAIVSGAGLIILSCAIAAYASLILIPVGIVITIVSALVGYVTVVRAWKGK